VSTADKLSSLAIGLVQILIVVGFLGGLWQLLNLATRSFDDHEEIFARGNVAYLIQRLGITAAQLAGLLSAVGVSGPHQWGDVGWLAIAGVWVTVLLLAVHPIIDRLVVARRRDVDATRSDDVAASLVKAAFYLGFGFVVNGSLTGTAPNVGTGLVATVVFTLLGGALLVGGYLLIDLVNPYPVRRGVREGRLASGFEAAGVLIALGLIMRNAIAGDFVGWGAALGGFALTAVVALVVLYLTRWLFDALVLTGTSIRAVHETNQVLPAALLAALLPLVALPVTTVIGSIG